MARFIQKRLWYMVCGAIEHPQRPSPLPADFDEDNHEEAVFTWDADDARAYSALLRCISKEVLPAVTCYRTSSEAGKIIANLVILGSGVLLRAFSQAYRQAIVNASKTGVAQETVQNMVKSSKAMTEQEARMILGISKDASVEDMLKRYENLFERNVKSGSFYLQSKVHRAKECLEAQANGQG